MAQRKYCKNTVSGRQGRGKKYPAKVRAEVVMAMGQATYEEIKKYVAKHNDGMKVSNLYIAQIKQKHGIIERENYNKPKFENGGQLECPKEKEIAIEEVLKYFQKIPSEP